MAKNNNPNPPPPRRSFSDLPGIDGEIRRQEPTSGKGGKRGEVKYDRPVPVTHEPVKVRRNPGRRSVSSRRSRSFVNRKRLIEVVVIVILAVVAAGLVYSLTRKNALTVSLGEETVGTIKRQNITAEDITKTVTGLLSSELGTETQLAESITLTPIHAGKDELVTVDSVTAKLKSTAAYLVKAAVIQVDGADVAVLVNQTEAQNLLQSLINEYVQEGTELESSGFTQNVQVVDRFVDANTIESTETVKTKLTTGTMTDKTYTVVTGDTLYGIAVAYDMTLEELQAKNPGVTPESLKVGQTLTVQVMVPYLSVKTVENQTYTEKQPKQTEYRTDSNLGSGVSKVVQQGKDGQREVVTQIVRINGFVEEEKEVSSNVTQEPVTEIIAVGP